MILGEEFTTYPAYIQDLHNKHRYAYSYTTTKHSFISDEHQMKIYNKNTNIVDYTIIGTRGGGGANKFWHGPYIVIDKTSPIQL